MQSALIKRILTAILILATAETAFSQQSVNNPFLASSTANGSKIKRPLDTADLGSFPTISNPKISPSGSHFCYTQNIKKQDRLTLLVQDIKKGTRIEFDYTEGVYFSNNDKRIFLHIGDTLLTLDTRTNQLVERTPAVRLIKPTNNNNYLLYFPAGDSQTLIVHRLDANYKQPIPHVSQVITDPGGRWIVIVQDQQLKVVDAASLKATAVIDTFTEGQNISSLICSPQGKHLAYIKDKTTGPEQTRSIWTYDIPDRQLRDLYTAGDFRGARSTIADNLEFTANGQWLFFDIETERKLTPEGPAKVDVWSYRDQLLAPEYKRISIRKKTSDSTERITWKACVSITGGKPVIVEQNEEIQTYPIAITGNHVLVKKGYYLADTWPATMPEAGYLLVDLSNGQRTRLLDRDQRAAFFSFSPNGDHLIYWDLKKGDYIIHDIKQNKDISLNARTNAIFHNDYPDDIFQLPVGNIAGWLQEGSAFFLYDQYDSWMIPLDTTKRPVNITNSFGRKHQLMLRLLPMGTSNWKPTDKNIILSAYNPQTKESGYYKLSSLTGGTVTKLSIGPYSTSRTHTQIDTYIDEDTNPIKAEHQTSYIISRQSATEAPNFYLTRDFTRFTPLTHYAPQANLNWLTTELVRWRSPDGQEQTGVLYKPEDFDSTRSYPLIFHYYEKMSNRLYQFPFPNFIETNIDVPFFVSNGYLVLEADMTFSNAAQSNITTGEHARITIESAIEYLRKRPYINQAKIGLSGHSFGGHLTNYIISHSTFPFAAASEAAGTSDLFWSYLSLMPLETTFDHAPKLPGIELGQGRIGATPWQRMDLYLQSSTVRQADKINTPLLIMHNKKDNQIPWNQGVALYMALTRLQKKVWLLQYENGTHAVFGADAVDYTIRLKQFFDHYLKDALPPVWMTRPLSEDKLNADHGFEMDRSGQQP